MTEELINLLRRRVAIISDHAKMGSKMGPLIGYPWSSLPSHAKGNGPDWLVLDRVLRSFELAQDGRGRRAYVAWLEARAGKDQGNVDEEAMLALRRGWYLGKDTFKDRLLKLLEKSPSKPASGRSSTGEAIRDHGEKEAGRIVRAGCKALGISSGPAGLAALSKSDDRKVLLASLLREKTTVSNDWIGTRLAMGHPGSVSRLIFRCPGEQEFDGQKKRTRTDFVWSL